ncbi:hypothetical protein HELRODRAFT_79030, partial [Helobdella robusta]|uniref:Protein Wnt n=1 Tax=Helobdella robusta TaxID=6412 RepID=T1G3I8_HELRO
GSVLGLSECRQQFEEERWNCPIKKQPFIIPAPQKPSNQLIPIIKLTVQSGTKEIAFIHAITSASLAHSITSSCSAGLLLECSCDRSLQSIVSTDSSWRWGGCSDNVQYGIKYSKIITDGDGKKAALMERVRSLVHLHNNDVGRKTLHSLMTHKCRCHGVSGSCAVRSCWRSLPSFRQVGDQLKFKYLDSVEISPSLQLADSNSHRDKRNSIPQPASDTDLIFLDKSPNYCRPDRKRGVQGTRDRNCQPDTDKPNNCKHLCCGRGYRTRVIEVDEACECQFMWCCSIQCKICKKVQVVHTCL